MRSAIRMVYEKTAHKNMAPDGGPEKDMNDQIAVGHYQTQSFEMSNHAQKLYSNLPKDTPIDSAVNAAIHLDKLFDLDKDTVSRNHATEADLKLAHEHANKVRALAKDMNLEDEHEKILKHSLSSIESRLKKKPPRIIDPEDHVHPTDDPRFAGPSKDFTTDRTSDRDVDNVKNFLIKRSLRGQRKLKIIDAD